MKWLLCLAALFFLEAYAGLFALGEAEAEAAGQSFKATDFKGKKPAPPVLASGSTFADCKDDCPTMVVIGTGHFLMGSAQFAREQPQHTVIFRTQYAVRKFDVTFDD